MRRRKRIRPRRSGKTKRWIKVRRSSEALAGMDIDAEVDDDDDDDEEDGEDEEFG